MIVRPFGGQSLESFNSQSRYAKAANFKNIMLNRFPGTSVKSVYSEGFQVSNC